MKKANNSFYGKCQDKNLLPEIGNMVLRGQLLKGKSANYLKKDWGEEYKAMLLKNNQVNELKLTDFETIQVEEEQIDNEQYKVDFNQVKDQSSNRSMEQIKQNQQIFKVKDDNYDQPILVLSGSKEKGSPNLNGLKIIDKPDDFQQQKKNRTGISLKEALENEEEYMQIKSLKGGLEGLNALVDQPRENKKSSSRIQDQKSDFFILNLQDNFFKKDDANIQLKKTVSDKQANKLEDIIDKQALKSNQDIYKIMNEQKKDSLKNQIKENIEKKPPSPKIEKVVNNEAIETQKKLSNDELQKQQNSDAPVQKPSSLNQKQGFSLLQSITNTTLMSSKPQPQQSKILSSLISQDTSTQPIQTVENKNPCQSIYDELNKQRQQSQQEKLKSVSNAKGNQKSSKPLNKSQQPSSNSLLNKSSTSNQNTQKTQTSSSSTLNKPQTDQKNNQINKISSLSNNKPGQSDSSQNSLSLLNEFTNNVNKNKQSSTVLPKQQASKDQLLKDDKMRNGYIFNKK